jgi:hypothetical protein
LSSASSKGSSSTAVAVPGQRQYLTEHQLAFINTFGYLVMPGLLADRLPAIEAAFSAVWDVDEGSGLPRRPGINSGRLHDDSERSYIVPFIDQHPTLSGLLSHRR